MSGHDPDGDDARLAAALRTALERRDRSGRAPRFTTMWSPDRRERASSSHVWRPLAASVASVVVVGGLVWTWIHREQISDLTAAQARIDPSLARQLSSAAYWRVPTDELLAYEAAPLHADLPSPTGLQISLEDSLL